MGHCISVFLIKKSELREYKIDSILEDKNITQLKYVDLGSDILATLSIPNKKEFGKNRSICSISTDYFGGSGYQKAKLFINNKKVYSESSEQDYSKNPINESLKLMGVVKQFAIDEFDVIGLGNYRSNLDFEVKF